MIGRSPYEVALGDEVASLSPALRRYFAAIPEGAIGVGEGVFDHIGTPRAWLRPLLAPFERRGVLFAGHERDVPFRIVNRTVAGRATAERTLLLAGRTWTMRDGVRAVGPGRVVDELGVPVTVAAAFDVRVVGGALVLRSGAVGIRLGRLRIRLPSAVTPLVRLTEQHGLDGRQRVEVTIDVPILGRVYAYGGWFDYRIQDECDAEITRGG